MDLLTKINQLTPQARKALDQILKRVDKTGSLDVLRSLDSIDYERPLVPPRQFLEDDKFLGKSVKELALCWKEVFDEVFGPGSIIGTLVLSGAIGTGKSTFAACCFARKIYELTCLKEPAAFYGLLPKSKIVFSIFNITLEKADDISGLLDQYMRESPYFQDNHPLRERPRFPLYVPTKRIEVASGSLSVHALGDSVFAFVLDEANFFKKAANPDLATEKTRAHQLFNEARSRQISRFMRGGRMPGLNIIISSKKFQSSFLDKFIEDASKDPLVQETVKIVEFALWQTKNPKNFSGEWFDVLVGTEEYPSRILEFDEVTPQGARVVRVPVEYYEPFVTDPDLALRDIAGISTAGSSAFFPVKAKIISCIDPGRTHPFTLPVISIPLRSGRAIADYFQERKLCKIESSSWVPVVHPEAERHIHIDLAYSGESIGITMTHPYTMNDARLGVYVDFMLKIKPPTVGELELGATVDFVKHLKNTYHFNIKKVTFDQFQSRMPIQLLVQAGFNAELLSIALIQYNHLKTCFNEHRINMYEYAPFLEEVDGLLKDSAGGRPFHKADSSDDICDSLAGAVSRCYNIPTGTTRRGKAGKDNVMVMDANRGPLVISVNQDRGQEEYRSQF